MRKKQIITALLSILTLLVMLMPMAQRKWKFFQLKPLNGVLEERTYRSFTMRNYTDGSFQSYVEGELADHFGFREWAIRLNNQCQWIFFRQWPHTSILLGQDSWLYWADDLNEFYYGLGCYHSSDTSQLNDLFRHDACAFFQLQQVLEECGIHPFVCIAPEKSHICSDYVPPLQNGYTCSLGRAYDFYSNLFPRLGIHYLDFNAYYSQLRGKVSYPLFYRFGSHWSAVSVAHMGDTLLRYIQHLGSEPLPRLLLGPDQVSPPQYQDNDLMELINLFWPISRETYYAAAVEICPVPQSRKPRLLAVGDSFCQTINFALPMDSIFDNYRYWYYFHDIRSSVDTRGSVADVDVLEEVLASDFIMLIWCPINIYQMGHTFVQKALVSLCIGDNRFEDVFQSEVADIQRDSSVMAQMESEGNGTANAAVRQLAYDRIYKAPEHYFPELKGPAGPACRNPRALLLLHPERCSDTELRSIQIRHDIHQNPQWVAFVKSQADSLLISDEEAFSREVRYTLSHTPRFQRE